MAMKCVTPIRSLVILSVIIILLSVYLGSSLAAKKNEKKRLIARIMELPMQTCQNSETMEVYQFGEIRINDDCTEKIECLRGGRIDKSDLPGCDNGKCVKDTDGRGYSCECLESYSGEYMRLGDVRISDDCTINSTCRANGKVETEDLPGCPKGVCTLSKNYDTYTCESTTDPEGCQDPVTLLTHPINKVWISDDCTYEYTCNEDLKIVSKFLGGCSKGVCTISESGDKYSCESQEETSCTDTESGATYLPGDVWISEDCQKNKTCDADSKITIEDLDGCGKDKCKISASGDSYTCEKIIEVKCNSTSGIYSIGQVWYEDCEYKRKCETDGEISKVKVLGCSEASCKLAKNFESFECDVCVDEDQCKIQNDDLFQVSDGFCQCEYD